MDNMLNFNSIINRVYEELIWADKVYRRACRAKYYQTQHFWKKLKITKIMGIQVNTSILKNKDLSRYLHGKVYYFDAKYLLIYN